MHRTTVGVIVAVVLLATSGTSALAAAGGTTAHLSYAPTRINFGRIAPLSSKTAAVVITNVGTQDLQYVGAQMLNGHNGTTFAFELVGPSPNCLQLPSGILAAGASCTASLLFDPLVKGTFKDTAMTMWSADGGVTLSDVTSTAVSGTS